MAVINEANYRRVTGLSRTPRPRVRPAIVPDAERGPAATAAARRILPTPCSTPAGAAIHREGDLRAGARQHTYTGIDEAIASPERESTRSRRTGTARTVPTSGGSSATPRRVRCRATTSPWPT
ncbi:hypothetical protein HBB16_01880 [Pseudonocardia sp. MCCB 268]|nr:hypothetical protein [Pseudonocardia cytotoxica]